MLSTSTTRILVLASVGSLLGACSTGAKQRSGETPDHHYFHKEEKPHAAEWGYTGDTGPSHWGDLSPDYRLASTGNSQSPIDISGAHVEALPEIAFDYHPAAIDLVYNGHTIEEMEDKQSSITVDGSRYVLAQFHFHTPSEHTIDGRHADMEMHLVHSSDDGEIAVVGVMIDAGAENPAFASVWGHLPTAANRERTDTVTVDASALLPENRTYYRYEGSLTTPPCTEGVHWMVMTTPVSLSQGQIDQFRAILEGNNRPVQPLNGRVIQVAR